MSFLWIWKHFRMVFILTIDVLIWFHCNHLSYSLDIFRSEVFFTSKDKHKLHIEFAQYKWLIKWRFLVFSFSLFELNNKNICFCFYLNCKRVRELLFCGVKGTLSYDISRYIVICTLEEPSGFQPTALLQKSLCKLKCHNIIYNRS